MSGLETSIVEMMREPVREMILEEVKKIRADIAPKPPKKAGTWDDLLARKLYRLVHDECLDDLGRTQYADVLQKLGFLPLIVRIDKFLAAMKTEGSLPTTRTAHDARCALVAEIEAIKSMSEA